jgi:acetoin utilization protein AcuB
VQEAADLLIEKKIRGLPVVDNGKVVGIVTTTDLLKAMLRLIEGQPR